MWTAASKRVRSALDRLHADGNRYAVLDVLNSTHIETVGRAVAGMKLVTGGSGLGDGMAKAWTDRLSDPEQAAAAGKPSGKRAVVLSGSCSQMTNAQVARLQAVGPVPSR